MLLHELPEAGPNATLLEKAPTLQISPVGCNARLWVIKMTAEMFSSVKPDFLLMGLSAHTQQRNVLCLVIRPVTLPALCAGFLNGEAHCSRESGYPCSWSRRSGPGHVALLLPVREINTGLQSPPLQHLSLEQSSHAFNMWKKNPGASQVAIQGSMCVLPRLLACSDSCLDTLPLLLETLAFGVYPSK